MPTGNRRVLRALGAYAVNLVSSPGSGKTTLLCETIEALGAAPLAVIEGDQQTRNDADRIRATGAQAMQINTGKGCHLDATMVGHAMDHLALATGHLSCSSRTSAIWSARPPSIWARMPRWRSCR